MYNILFNIHLIGKLQYCDMTPEGRDSEARIDVPRGNEYASNNQVTSVAMQRRCKHAFPIKERLCFLRGTCKVVIKKSSVEAVQ
jgi:hypothetical protein